MVLAIVSGNVCWAGNAWTVRPDGIGPVKIGMSLSQLNAVLHETFSMPESKDDRACFYVGPAKYPDISFMIERGRLSRIDIDGASVSTAEGIHIGDSESHTRKVYGSRLKVEPHAYTGEGGGHYLTMYSSDGRYGIRFETDGKKVVGFYAGKSQAIAYIEGCE